jgi:hypothetical protein
MAAGAPRDRFLVPQITSIDKEEALEGITPLTANQEITLIGFPRLTDSVFDLIRPALMHGSPRGWACPAR